MFENFSFSKPNELPAARPRINTSTPSTEQPLSPLHSPGPSPVDSSSCYSYFSAPNHHDPLTSTLLSLALSRPQNSPDNSDTESNLVFEDVRRKRQSMARMQTNDDVLRQLTELVKRVSVPSSRKGSTGSHVESSGVSKKTPKSRRSSRSSKSSKPSPSKRKVVAA